MSKKMSIARTVLATGAVLVLELVAYAPAVEAGFAAPVQYATAGDLSGPRFVAVADFNRDGLQDLAVANRDSTQVSVLLGQAVPAGSFGTAAVTSVGALPESIAVGDFDRDGALDLAVAYAGSTFVSVLLNNGSGGFPGTVNYATGGTGFTRSVVVGDFNRDGFLDLATAGSQPLGAGKAFVWLGTVGGNFASAIGYPTGGDSPWALAVGDFNKDGRQDLAVTDINTGGGVGRLDPPWQ